MNNGGNMDLGTNGFTSDVSLPKDKANKTQAMVNKLQLAIDRIISTLQC